jgi:MEMO1 family protein
MTTRKSDFAGTWYPSKGSECRRIIEGWIETDEPCPKTREKPAGGIVPHAGWVFSGKLACGVVRCLHAGGRIPETVVLFGKHLHPGSRNYIMKEGQWATPLGELSVDADLGEGLASRFEFVTETASRYDQDNTIELQLPLLKYFFPEAKILPLGLPPSASSLVIGEAVAEIAETIGRRIIVLGSTDLTHYGPNYGFTPRGTGIEAVTWVKNGNDRRIVDLILKLDAAGVIHESLRNQNACCGGAVAAAIAAAKKLGAGTGLELSYSSSYDIRPDSSFVGYTGILFA